MTRNNQLPTWIRRAGKALAGAAVTATTLLLLMAIRIVGQDAPPIYSVLYSFTGGLDGATPRASLIADAAGNLYGTTPFGGNVGGICGFRGCGVVFELDPSGNETVLHAFGGGSDGANPYSSVIRDAAGNLYGATAGGGLDEDGVVFSLDAAGKETVLHTFTGGVDGAIPQAGLLRDAVGNLYGTTEGGGDFAAGVVFKLDAAGIETVLYSFTGGADGGTPSAGLIQDSAGNFYGVTQNGGIVTEKCFGRGCGVVFKLDPSGTETVLYRFRGDAGGGEPEAKVVRDEAGNLYGTTAQGGKTGGQCQVLGCGVIFEVDPSGKETVLHTFGPVDGPGIGGVIRDFAGNLYGATSGLFVHYGVVFELTPAGGENILHAFTNQPDGAQSQSQLLSYRGSLYGTTTAGGVYNAGVVFKITLH